MHMKQTLITTATFTAAITAALCSCSNGSDNRSTTDADSSSSHKWVSELVSSTKTYPGTIYSDTASLTLSATVEWPVSFGSAPIKVLQDSILTIAFNNGNTLDTALDNFINDTGTYGFTIDKSISTDQNHAYMKAITARRTELTTKTVNFQIYCTEYMGGAHPMSVSRTLTYVFDPGVMLTIDNLFNREDLPELTHAINQSAAMLFNAQPFRLTDAGFFTDTIPASPFVSIADGLVSFHYNQYEIAPYSFGPIDVTLSMYWVRDYLTPLGLSLLDD